jgi:cyclophilin family peptidyl-prolyl cis-trans isomerase/chaperonin cofactor prefoldin
MTRILVRLLLVSVIGGGIWVGWSMVTNYDRHMLEQLKIQHQTNWNQHKDALTRDFQSKLVAIQNEKVASVNDLELRLATLQTENQGLQDDKRQAEQDLQQLQQELQQKLEAQQLQNTELTHRIEHVTTDVEHLKSYKEKMHEAIQHMSKTIVLEKWGPGPHRIEMLLTFNPLEPGVGTANRIVLELAPLDEMPHAVYWFLSQVSLGLWNGCSFHRNADHVLQAGAVRNFNTPAKKRISDKNFEKAGFGSILFQEYSPHFPHVPLTIGYAGRPGGPDFYISILDNTENHGPGGQSSYDDVGEADPCFGKVVEGEEVVQRMHGLERRNDDYQGLVHYVEITVMNILSTT